MFFLIIFWNNSDGPKRILLLCFPYCQSNFIKSFDGGLQYKVIRTFTFRSVIFTSLDAFFKGIDGFDGLIKFGGILAGFIVETVASIMFRSCDFLYSVPRAIFKQVSESVKFKYMVSVYCRQNTIRGLYRPQTTDSILAAVSIFLVLLIIVWAERQV